MGIVGHHAGWDVYISCLCPVGPALPAGVSDLVSLMACVPGIIDLAASPLRLSQAAC